MKRAGLVVTGAAVLTAVSIPASAFVLPTSAILGKTAKHRRDLGFETLILEGWRGTAENPKQAPARLYIRANKGYRLEVGSDAKSVLLVTEGKRWTFAAGTTPGPGERIKADLIADFYARPASDKGSERGLAFLDAFGIKEDVVSYGRHDGRVVWIIGAKPWESDKPQLWIDKLYRAPVRLITIDPKTKAKTDVQAFGLGSALTGEWYPARVDTYQDGALVERLSFSSVKVNEPIDAALISAPSK